MLGSLTVKPLLIACAVLALLLTASGALNARLYKQLGAAKAECVAQMLSDSNERSQITNTAAEDALRHRVTELESQLARSNQVAKAADNRQATGSAALAVYKDELNEARKVDPTLDAPVDIQRLRNLETAYRVRSKGSGSVRVQETPSERAP